MIDLNSSSFYNFEIWLFYIHGYDILFLHLSLTAVNIQLPDLYMTCTCTANVGNHSMKPVVLCPIMTDTPLSVEEVKIIVVQIIIIIIHILDSEWSFS